MTTLNVVTILWGIYKCDRLHLLDEKSKKLLPNPRQLGKWLKATQLESEAKIETQGAPGWLS